MAIAGERVGGARFSVPVWALAHTSKELFRSIIAEAEASTCTLKACATSQCRRCVLTMVAATSLFATHAHAAPTFADIAPILDKYCVQCHRPGEAGPFSLLSYADAKAHASQIADLTRRRIMPPWLPEHGKGDFKDELRLTDAQIQTIAAWIAAGAPDSATDASPPPHFVAGWQLG